MKTLATIALTLAVLTSASAQQEPSLEGTAWQCGPNYIQITFIGMDQEGLTWPNQKGPVGKGQETLISQLGRPGPAPFWWRNCPKNCQLTYYDKKRYKPCIKVKPESTK
jgi:hypothetical protein